MKNFLMMLLGAVLLVGITLGATYIASKVNDVSFADQCVSWGKVILGRQK